MPWSFVEDTRRQRARRPSPHRCRAQRVGAAAALAAVREAWEPESTAYLSLIRESRAQRGETIEWANELEDELLKAAGNG